jgi:hypothetical protein
VGALVVVAVLVAGALGAVGAIGAGSKSAVVRACVSKQTGALRIVSAKRRCLKTERRLTWNQRGARGPAGKGGRAGATGPQGSQGPAGAAPASVVMGNTDTNLPGLPGGFSRYAPSGYTPSGGLVGADTQVSPGTTIIVRDLFVRLGGAPGAGASRTVKLLAGAGTALSCTISDTNETCSSGDASATVAPGTDLTLEQSVGETPASSSPGLRWSFRTVTP